MAFPYDATIGAIKTTVEMAADNSDLHAVHLDLIGCVPWEQAMSGEPFPSWITDEFSRARARFGSSHTMYVSVTPTDQSRVEMVPQCGLDEGTTAPWPGSIDGRPYDDPAVQGAFAAWTQRVVDELEPAYLVVGIEISELVVNARDRWDEFASLYDHVRRELRGSHPDLLVGPEMVLQSLMDDRVGTTVSPLVESSDFLGISFYPYGSETGERVGVPPLPPPPDQWRVPLEWLKTYTDRPIAIAETGYTTETVHLESVDMSFAGDAALQQHFLTDLLDTATRDKYLFVVWFVPIDYTPLVEKIGNAQRGHADLGIRGPMDERPGAQARPGRAASRPRCSVTL